MKSHKINSNFKAFTIIELLVVVALLASLTVIFYPVAQKAFRNMRVKQAKSDIVNIEAALSLYYNQFKIYPQATTYNGDPDCLPRDALDGLVRFEQSRSRGDTFVDPWYQPYRYEYPGTNNTSFVDIASGGADMDEGNWQADTGNYDAANTELIDNINNWTEK